MRRRLGAACCCPCATRVSGRCNSSAAWPLACGLRCPKSPPLRPHCLLLAPRRQTRHRYCGLRVDARGRHRRGAVRRTAAAATVGAAPTSAVPLACATLLFYCVVVDAAAAAAASIPRVSTTRHHRRQRPTSSACSTLLRRHSRYRGAYVRWCAWLLLSAGLIMRVCACGDAFSMNALRALVCMSMCVCVCMCVYFFVYACLHAGLCVYMFR